MKILCVEDNLEFVDQLSDLLKAERYTIDVAIDGQTGWELAEASNYDLILLDVMLPKLDGIRLCQRIRHHGKSVPILLLTARGTNEDKVLGLDSGADDYLVKPIAVSELMARIRALLRRNQTKVQTPILEWGDFSLDPSTHEVKYGNFKLLPTPKEYALLELFLRNSQQTWSRSAILENLWSLEAETPGEDTVKCHIKGLRSRLKAVGAGELIETVYGLGYRLNPLFLKSQHRADSDWIEEKSSEPTPRSPQTHSPCTPLVLLVTTDQVNATHFSQAAESWGFRVMLVSNVGLLNILIEEFEPKALIFDLDGLSLGQYQSQLAEIRSYADIPILIWADHTHTLADRMAIARLGKTTWISKSIAPNQAVMAVMQTLQTQPQPRILWVDDELLRLTLLQEISLSDDIQITVLNDPTEFWQTLNEFKPNFVILGEKINDISGIALCQAIRKDWSWNWLPVMLLTTKTDPETMCQISAAGVDDTFNYLVDASVVIDRIHSRINHNLLLQNQLTVDRLTGAYNRQAGTQKIETLIHFLKQAHQTLSLVVLEIDPIAPAPDFQPQVLSDQIQQQVAQLLQHELNSEELMIRWNESEWVIGLYSARSESVHRMAEILETLRQMTLGGMAEAIRVSFSAGVAQFPKDGNSLQVLYYNAHSSLAQAQSLGGDRILPTGWKQTLPINPTVAVVHPDLIFADAVLCALETRGYSYRWLSNPVEAIAQLLESTPCLLPEAIVITGNLRHFRGLDILKALSKNKITQMVKVIVIVSDTKEAEKALKLGANAYLMTPCSSTLLIQKLSQVLAS
jgi:diguanylate cyclase (GGDEF)-like protein